MSEKTQQKKQLILDYARKVFACKGYKAVTMKDIVEACDISRGGLYLYFSSVEELFLAVLHRDEEEAEEEFSKAVLEEATNVQMLLCFLKTQKKEILKKNESLLMAKYEYAFACRENKQESLVKENLEKGALVLEKILERGTKSGEFACFDVRNEAKDMMYAIEGMKLLAAATGISEKRVDTEFLHMMQRIVIDEEE